MRRDGRGGEGGPARFLLGGLLLAGTIGAGCRAAADEPSTVSSAPAPDPEASPGGPGRLAAHGDGELEDEALAELEDARDGAWLYERNCSGCHGPTGAGDGVTAKELGVQPRNFNQGGFSFGNTREDLFRTISSGIPGRSVMPSFRGVLPDEDIGLIIDHVRTLMPPQDEQDARASVLAVGVRPVVARGKLPPIAEGLPERPRGLLVGLPSGLTFEYDAEDVRLLGVRLGPFADREDWRSRGGGYLRPLGQPIYIVREGELDAPFVIPGFDAATELRARLLGTWTGRTRAGLEYRLSSDHSDLVVRVDEHCGFVATSRGAGFSRTLQLMAETGEGYVGARLAGPGDAEFVRQDFETLPVSWRPMEPPKGGQSVAGATPLARPGSWVFPWFVAHHADGVDECILVRLVEPLVEPLPGADGRSSRRPLEVGFVGRKELGLRANLVVRPDSVSTVEVVTVLTSGSQPELLAALAEEVLR